MMAWFWLALGVVLLAASWYEDDEASKIELRALCLDMVILVHLALILEAIR